METYLSHLRSLGVTEATLSTVLPMAFRLLDGGRYAMVELRPGEEPPEHYVRSDLPVDVLLRPGHPKPVLFLMPPSCDAIARVLLQASRVTSTVPAGAAPLTAALWPPPGVE